MILDRRTAARPVAAPGGGGRRPCAGGGGGVPGTGERRGGRACLRAHRGPVVRGRAIETCEWRLGSALLLLDPQTAPRAKVRTGVRAGGVQLSHNQTKTKIRTGVRAGGVQLDHNSTRAR